MPLKVSDGMGAWIDDFQKSDAPQFKGHTKEKRRDQAIAAYLSAKKGPQKESVNEAKKFYLFSNEKTLEYRGRLDDSSPGNGIEPSGIDVREAIENLLNGKEVNQAQHPSMGCNIKWK